MTGVTILKRKADTCFGIVKEGDRVCQSALQERVNRALVVCGVEGSHMTLHDS